MIDQSSTASGESSDDQFLAEVFDEVARRLQTGEDVDLQALVGKYPERVEQVEKLIPTLDLLVGVDTTSASDEAVGTTASPHDATAAPPQQTLGDFRIAREIGRGGMGVVYEAQQISLGRRVALKVLPFAAVFDQRQVKRFQNEAQAAAQLHHQHIVPVFAVGCERGVHYYAMQYIEGQTLAEAIAELREKTTLQPGAYVGRSTAKGPSGGVAPAVTPRATTGLTSVSSSSRELARRIAEIGTQAADALAYAHNAGVIHRDIKPGNLLLDARGDVWITDFGLAQFQGDASLTVSGDILGTLRYMSPEQALGKRVDVDERTDVYSLGITLYELLTLEPAISGTERKELLRKVAFEEPSAPRKLKTGIPLELETIVLKAIEKNPRERYASAADLADDLRLYLADKPIRARRSTALQRGVKWARRHRTLVVSLWVASALSLVLIAAGAGLLALKFGIIAEKNRQEANRNAEIAAENDEVAKRNGLLAEQRREQLVRSFVANGVRRFEEGDVTGALVLFVFALDLDAGDAARETPHRMRIASTLDRCPRPVRVEGAGVPSLVAIGPNGRRYLYHDAAGWKVRDEERRRDLFRGERRAEAGAFSDDGRLVFIGGRGWAEIRDVESGAPVSALETNDASLRRPVFSRDGNRVVTVRRSTASSANIVETWDVPSGRRIGPGLDDGFMAAPYSVSPSGHLVSLIVTARAIDVRDPITGTSVLPDDLIRHGFTIQWKGFSRDGRLFGSAGAADGTVQVFSTDTWRRVALLAHPGNVVSFDLSPDGRVAVTGGTAGLVRVWALPGGSENGWLLRERKRRHTQRGLRFAPDGKRIVMFAENAVEVWDYEVDTALEFHEAGDIQSAWIAEDGRFLFARGPGRPGRLTVWDLAAVPSAGPALTGSRGTLFSENDGDGMWGTRYTIVNDPDGRVRVQDRFARQALNVRRTGSPAVWTAAASRDGRHVATAGIDGTARVWDRETFLPRTPPLAHAEVILHTEFSADGRSLLTVSGRFARVWDAASGVARTPRLSHDDRLIHASFAPEGRLVATAGNDRAARMWDVESGRPVGAPLVHDHPVTLARFSPNGELLVTGTHDYVSGTRHAGAVYVWEVATGKLVHRLERSWPTDVSFSPDGRRIAAAFAQNGPGSACGVVWDIETGKELSRTSPHGCAEGLEFSPDGHSILTNGLDRNVRISDPATGRPRITVPFSDPVFAARFSPHYPKEAIILTASSGGWAQIRDARTGEWVSPPLEHPGPLRGAQFTSDGRGIVTASYAARIHNVRADERPVAELVDIAHAIAGRRVDPELNHLSPLGDELTALRERLLSARREHLAPSRERALEWRQRKAEDAYLGGRWADAVAHLDALIEAESWRYTNLVLRGHALAELGHWSQAADDFERAVRLGESDPWIQHCAGLAHLSADDLDGYRLAVERMLARTGSDAPPNAVRWLAWVCSLAPAAVPDPGALIRRLESTREASFEKPMTELCLGALAFRAGEFEKAASGLRAAIEARPASPSSGLALLFLALSEEARNRFREAQAALDKAAEMEFTNGFWSAATAVKRLEEEAARAVLRHRNGSPARRIARFRRYVDEEKWTIARLALDALDPADMPAGRETLARSLLQSAKASFLSRRYGLALRSLDLADEVGGPFAELSRMRFETLVAAGRIDEAVVASDRVLADTLKLKEGGRANMERLLAWRVGAFAFLRDFDRAREALASVVQPATAAAAPALANYVEALVKAAVEEFRRLRSAESLRKFLGVALVAGYRSALRGEPIDAPDSALNILARAATHVELVNQSASWRYLDDGTDQGNAWRRPDFDDASWSAGRAPLGFGDEREATLLRRTTEAGSQPLAYYFRRRFQAEELKPWRRLILRIVRDDGAAVYINGKEVVRQNLPADEALSSSTPAARSMNGADETQVHQLEPLAVDVLRPGENLIAVELHQASATSSDAHFEASLHVEALESWAYLAGFDEAELEAAIDAVVERLPSSIAAAWSAELRFVWLATHPARAGPYVFASGSDASRARHTIQEALAKARASRERERE